MAGSEKEPSLPRLLLLLLGSCLLWLLLAGDIEELFDRSDDCRELEEVDEDAGDEADELIVFVGAGTNGSELMGNFGSERRLK